MLELAVVAVAVTAGIAGTWSPCGFSLVDTIARGADGVRSRASALAAFAGGAAVGGVTTFAALGALGALAGGGGALALAAAAAVAGAAAIADAGGARVVPQVRRQVPEPWRRVLRLPVAAGLYGILLGLGFTTFVLTFASWALAAIVVAAADVRLGVTAGLAFGVARALPVVVLVPLAHTDAGSRATELMAERPGILRGCRAVAALSLATCAVALGAASASAATPFAADARNPTVAGLLVAWQRASDVVVVRPEGQVVLPGADPALGGSLFAWRRGETVQIAPVADFAAVTSLSLPGADALAVSDTWLVYRRRGRGREELVARRHDTGAERVVATVTAPAQLGRPALAGEVIVFHVARPRTSSILQVNLATSRRRVLRTSRLYELSNPSIVGGALLYVRRSNTHQLLLIGPRRPNVPNRVLHTAPATVRRDDGFQHGYSRRTRTPRAQPRGTLSFWTTALSEQHAYLTLVPVERRLGPPRIVRVTRR